MVRTLTAERDELDRQRDEAVLKRDAAIAAAKAETSALHAQLKQARASNTDIPTVVKVAMRDAARIAAIDKSAAVAAAIANERARHLTPHLTPVDSAYPPSPPNTSKLEETNRDALAPLGTSVESASRGSKQQQIKTVHFEASCSKDNGTLSDVESPSDIRAVFLQVEGVGLHTPRRIQEFHLLEESASRGSKQQHAKTVDSEASCLKDNGSLSDVESHSDIRTLVLQERARVTAMAQSNKLAEKAWRAKVAAAESAAEVSAGRLREANAALNASREREAALILQIKATEEEKVELQRAAMVAADAASERLAGVRADMTQLAAELEEARSTAHGAAGREAVAIAQVRKLETQQRAAAAETAAAQQEAHASGLQAAREEAKAAASAAAAMAVARGARPAVPAHGSRDDSLGGVAELREVREPTTQLREGELVAVRQLLDTSERQKATLVKQLAAERDAHRRAVAEAIALERSLDAEYTALKERHVAALKMLGEKESERLILQNALDALIEAGR